MRRRSRKPAKPKKITYEFIDKQSEVGRPMYAMVRELVDSYHEGLKEARIAVAWALAWKPDQDGYIVTVKISRASDLHRELAPYELVLQINREWFYRPSTTPHLQRVEIDKVLHSVTCRLDGTGATMHDEHLRALFRGVRPDVQEYKAHLERWGIYSSEIERLEMIFQRVKFGRVPGQWIGATRLRAAIKTVVGLDIPIDEINTWPKDDREAIDEWLQVKAEMGDAPEAITNALAEPKRITDWRASSALPFEQPAEAPTPEPETVAH